MDRCARAAARNFALPGDPGVFTERDGVVRVLAEAAAVRARAPRAGRTAAAGRRRDMAHLAARRPARTFHNGIVPANARGDHRAPATGAARAVHAGGPAVGSRAGAAARG